MLKGGPFDPFLGKKKGLDGEIDLTRVPMMQVVEEDTHDNYVVCRGYDPDYQKFFDRLSVAKPYGQRGQTGIYAVGEVHPAVKAITMLGTTPGVASVSTGHPADLDEQVNKLTDDEGIDVQWMFIGTTVGNHDIVIAKLNTYLRTGYLTKATILNVSSNEKTTGVESEYSGEEDIPIVYEFEESDTEIWVADFLLPPGAGLNVDATILAIKPSGATYYIPFSVSTSY